MQEAAQSLNVPKSSLQEEIKSLGMGIKQNWSQVWNIWRFFFGRNWGAVGQSWQKWTAVWGLCQGRSSWNRHMIWSKVRLLLVDLIMKKSALSIFNVGLVGVLSNVVSTGVMIAVGSNKPHSHYSNQNLSTWWQTMLLLRLAYSINVDKTVVLLWRAVRRCNGRCVQLAVSST